MKLKDISKDDLELMSYDDLAALVLTESGKKMKVIDIFKKIAKALNMSDREFENKIADFFEILSTDKKFTILPNGYCDLREKHNVELVIDDEDEEIIDPSEIEEEEDIEDEDEDEEDIFYDAENEDDDTDDDDLQDLVIIDEEDEANSI